MQANQHLLRDLFGRARMADEVAGALVAWDCPCFGLPGDAVNPLVDALRRRGAPYLHVRHEATAAYAALGSSILSGRVAACVAATGPGATHLTPGLVEACRQRAGVVAVTGLVPVELEGSRSFQELDLDRTLPGTFVAAARLRVAGHGVLAAEMIVAALEARGPTMLGVSAPVLLGPPSGLHTHAFALGRPALDGPALRDAAAAVAGRRVRWVIGRGCPRAVVARLFAHRQAVLGLPEAFGAFPRGTPVWGRDPVAATAGELWIGLGEETGSMARALGLAADRVLCTGGLARPGSLVARRVAGPLGPCVDALLFAAARGDQVAAQAPASLDVPSPIARAADAILGSRGVVCVDRSEWGAQIAADLPRHGRRLLGSGGDEGHGAAVGLSIGAAAAGRDAVAIIDEDGLLECVAEIATLAKYDLPVTLLVVGPTSLDLDRLANSLGVGGSGRPRVMRGPIWNTRPTGQWAGRPGSLAANLVPTIRGLGAHVASVGRHPALDEVRAAGDLAPPRTIEAGSMAASARAKATGCVSVVLVHGEAESLRSANGAHDAAYDRSGVLVVRLGGERPAPPLVEGARVTRLDQGGTAVNVLGHAISCAGADGYGELHASLEELGRPSSSTMAIFPIVAAEVRVTPPPAALAAARAAVQDAVVPVVVAGRGATAAVEETRHLAAAAGAPLVLTLPARGAFTLDEPGVAGGLGSSGHAAAHGAVDGADLAVVLGVSSRGNAFGKVPRSATVYVNNEARALARCPGIAVHGSVQAVARELAPARGRPATRRDRLAARLARFLARTMAPGLMGLTPPQVCAEVDEVLAGTDVPVCLDVGLNTLWSFRFLRRARLVSSGNFGTMGFALPAAIALAEEGRPALALCGDGGALMAIGALAGARTPAVVVVFNNGALDAIRWEMWVNGLAEHESKLGPVDFVALAQALGCGAERIVGQASLRAGLRRALAAGGPYLLDVHANPHYLPSPVGIHPRQAAGFALGLFRELILLVRRRVGRASRGR